MLRRNPTPTEALPPIPIPTLALRRVAASTVLASYIQPWRPPIGTDDRGRREGSQPSSAGCSLFASFYTMKAGRWPRAVHDDIYVRTHRHS
jgi:hypothetical protein